MNCTQWYCLFSVFSPKWTLWISKISHSRKSSKEPSIWLMARCSPMYFSSNSVSERIVNWWLLFRSRRRKKTKMMIKWHGRFHSEIQRYLCQNIGRIICISAVLIYASAPWSPQYQIYVYKVQFRGRDGQLGKPVLCFTLDFCINIFAKSRRKPASGPPETKS